MRRLLVAAASGAVLLLGAACSTDTSDDTAAPTATTAAAPATSGGSTGGSAAPSAPAAKPGAAGDAELAANTDAICTQATKVSGNAVATFATESKTLAGVRGKEGAQQVESRVRRGLEAWAFALRDLGGLTGDAALKKTFTAQSGKVEKLMEGDLYKIQPESLEAIRKDVGAACGQ